MQLGWERIDHHHLKTILEGGQQHWRLELAMQKQPEAGVQQENSSSFVID